MEAADSARIIERLKELQPAITPVYKTTDIGDGQLFADVFKDRARYVDKECWYIYDGRIWAKDVNGLRAMNLCKSLANALLAYTSEISDDKLRESYSKHVCRWQNRRTRETILKDAKDVYPISKFEFDASPYLINCENGTLNIETGKFLPHDSKDLLTKLATVTYDPSAKNDRFTEFVSEISSNDTEKAEFLQKAFGYGIAGYNYHECMFILYGATSRNGKSTLCESVLNVLGNYACSSNPETLAKKTNNDSTKQSEDVARLNGIRFANFSEPPKNMTMNGDRVKAMTGRDTLNARFLNENSFEFRPQFKMYMSTNFKPLIDDPALFASGRIVLIPFDRHFSESERDIHLKDKFAESQCRSAILNWLIEGYRKLQQSGFTQPDSIKEAIKEYRKESDLIAQFVDDCLIADTSEELRMSDVFNKYKSWCLINKQPQENQTAFKASIQHHATVLRRRPRTGGEKTTLMTGFRFKNGI